MQNMTTFSPQFSQKQEQEVSRDSVLVEFRAPPPSPVASSRRRRSSSVTNDDVLSDFLEHSLRVPDLVLPPGRIFSRQNSLQDHIPTVDFRALTEDGSLSEIRASMNRVGCFQLVNHGISPELIRSVENGAARIFRASVKKKRKAVRSPEMPFGFEQVSGEQEEEAVGEMSEEFVWGRSCDFKLRMEGIWPAGYSNFCEKMEMLTLAIEKISKEIMLVLQESSLNMPIRDQRGNVIPKGNEPSGTARCHIFKHPRDLSVDRCIRALRHDVIRMMIRGSDYSHALSVHISDESSEFHVYTKKGWFSFTPSPFALVVTSGDQIQAWSGGQYKQVIGRPIYTNKNQDCISTTFLYSPPSPATNMEFSKTISLREQTLFAIFFTIACQFLFFIYNKL